MPDVFSHRHRPSSVHQGRIRVLVEFALPARNRGNSQPFLPLSQALAMHIAACSPAVVEDLARRPPVRDPARAVVEWLKQSCDRLGASVEVTRFIRGDPEPERTRPVDPPPDHAASARQRVSGH